MMEKPKKIYSCFPGGKHKALTMSYDDGREEDRRLVSIFNKNGIKGTFNLNAGIRNDPNRIPLEEYKTLYQGHEIASHTLTHPTIERCATEHVASQVLEDRKELEKIVGYPVRGLAYPNGSYSNEIKQLLPLLGIRYARIVGNSENFSLPQDPFEWKATCHHNYNLLDLADKFLSLHKTQYLYLMYVWGHSYEFTSSENWDLMESFCSKMSGKDDIWYATNIQIIDNMEVCRRLCYAADGSFVYNPSASSAWISVDNDIVEVKGGTQVSL